VANNEIIVTIGPEGPCRGIHKAQSDNGNCCGEHTASHYSRAKWGSVGVDIECDPTSGTGTITDIYVHKKRIFIPGAIELDSWCEKIEDDPSICCLEPGFYNPVYGDEPGCPCPPQEGGSMPNKVFIEGPIALRIKDFSHWRNEWYHGDRCNCFGESDSWPEWARNKNAAEDTINDLLGNLTVPGAHNVWIHADPNQCYRVYGNRVTNNGPVVCHQVSASCSESVPYQCTSTFECQVCVHFGSKGYVSGTGEIQTGTMLEATNENTILILATSIMLKNSRTGALPSSHLRPTGQNLHRPQSAKQ
jgi:hypothetical protein